jgi:uncharacterized protein YndB with AHSA1/START domain
MTAKACSTDRIEKRVVLRAPRERVWLALSDAGQFGSWFGVDFTGVSFAPGATARGKLTVPGYEHLTMEVVIDRVEPERLLSFRWHPYVVDPNQDYSKEPTTLVVFELRDLPEGTELTVTESGFDRIPLHRRAEALRMNDAGWAGQMKNVEAYVARTR